jgi:pimeloyl-ACP methyl ester carboxylesterase
MYDLISLVTGTTKWVGGWGPYSTNTFGINNEGQIVSISNAGTVLLTPTVLTTTTNRTPDQALTSLVTVSNTNLEVFTYPSNHPVVSGTFLPGGTVDTSKPTIVFTHGFFSDPTMWNDCAKAIASATNVNIVAWNWHDVARSSIDPGVVYPATQPEGTALGLALGNILGSNYQKPVQFIGHSLGCLVNAQAINEFHSLVGGATIQHTMFDEAEEAGVLNGVTDLTSLVFWLGPLPWYEQPIPQNGAASRIDNYISSYGIPHSAATNIVLDKPLWMDYLLQFHGYPTDWYRPTISGTTLGGLPAPSNAGFNISILKSPLIVTNGTNTYYEGATDGSVNQITSAEAGMLICSRDLDILDPDGYVSGVETVSADLVNSGIQITGHAVVSLGKGMVVGVNAIKDKLIGSLAESDDIFDFSDTVPNSSVPAYVWIPVTIPANAQTMTFSFAFNNLSPGDYLTAGIGTTQLFALESKYVPNGITETSPPVNVSQWAGQNVELFIGLNTVDANNIGGSVTVNNITFGLTSPLSTIVSGLSVTGTNSSGFNYTTYATNSPSSFSATGLPNGLNINASTGIISGTHAQTGSFKALVSLVNASGTSTATMSFTLFDTPATWKTSEFTPADMFDPQVSGDLASPANDGISNLMKYALDLNPYTPSAQSLPQVSTMMTGSGTFLTLTYSQYKFASGITLVPEVSQDMVTWQSGPTVTSVVSTTDNPDGVTQAVVVQDLIPVSPSGRNFMRLEVTEP